MSAENEAAPTIEVGGQKYQLIITGDAEVTPGESKE